MDKHNAYCLNSDIPAVEELNSLDGAGSDKLVLIMNTFHSIENSWYFTDQGVSIEECQEGLTDIRDHF